MLAVELSVDEKIQLSQLEATIEAGFKGFYEAGQALARIQENRLYRANYSTFEDYCRDRWSISRQRAYELIKVAEVCKDLSGKPDILPLIKKTHAVALIPADPELRAEIVQEISDTSPNGKITTAHVEQAVARHKEPSRNGWLQAEKTAETPKVLEAVEVAQKRGNITPNSTAKVLRGDHAGKTVVVSRVEGGAIAHSQLPSGGSFPFLVGELEVVEAAPMPEKVLKPSPKEENESLKGLLKEVYCEVGAHLSVELRDRVEAALA